MTAVSVGSNYAYRSKVDENGTDYLIGNLSNAIFQYTKAGVLSQIPFTAFNPKGIAVDGAGTLYMTPNGYGSAVATYTTAGVQGSISIIPPAPYVPCANSGGLEYLADVVVDGAGDIFVLDILCNQVFERKADGTYATYAINPSITQPNQLAVDDAGNIFVSGYTLNERTTGGTQTQINAVGAGDGLAVDASGIVYATRYNPAGSSFLYGVAELQPSDYTTPTIGLDPSTQPLGLGLGSDGTLFVGNYTNLDIVDRSQGKIDFGSLSSGTSSSTKSIQILNIGNQPLTVSSLVLAGAGYTLQTSGSQDCSNGSVIPPATYCQVSVSVTPAHAGNTNGSLTITTNSLNTTSTQVSNFTSQVYGVYVTANPATLTFPAQVLNTASTAQTVTLTNQGLGYTANVYNFNVPAGFAVTQGTCSAGIAPGASCQLSVTFTPTASQNYSGVITATVTSSGGGTSQQLSFNVSGTVAAPQPVVSVTSLAFANTNVGSASAAQTFTLSNTGTGVLTISGISIAGANPADFAQTNTCGTSVAVGATCNISVTFTPASAATFNATVNIADNATGSPQTVPLSGTGISLLPQAVFSPTSLSFLSTTVGSNSTAKTVTLSNPGNAALSISSISVAGANPADFAQTNTCGSSVAAGASCTFSVIFTPVSAATFNASLSIADNATGSPHTVPLSGAGTALSVPQAVLSPASLTFTSSTVGSTSAAQTLTLSNPGNATLSLSGVSLTGANPADYAVTTTCGTSLAAGSSCTISVTFTPVSAASFNATVSVADNASGSPQTAALTGTGAAPADFTTSASTSTQTVTAGGAAQFVIAVLPQGGTFNGTVTFSAAGLPAGATASFQPASISPGSTGATTTLTIQTAARHASLSPARWTILPQGVALALVAPLCLWRFRRGNRSRDHRLLRGAFVLTLLTAGITALSGCGGGLVFPSAPATYSITVTGTSGSATHSTTVSLIVQ